MAARKRKKKAPPFEPSRFPHQVWPGGPKVPMTHVATLLARAAEHEGTGLGLLFRGAESVSAREGIYTHGMAAAHFRWALAAERKARTWRPPAYERAFRRQMRVLQRLG